MNSITAQDQKEFKYTKTCSTTFQEFDELYRELFNRTWLVNGKEYNLSELGWSRDYNNRKRSLGTCQVKIRRGLTRELYAKKVNISKCLLIENLDKAYDFEDTIRHEIAHAIHIEMEGTTNHGPTWKMIARELGGDDSRLHEGFLEKPKGKYTLVCGTCNYQSEKYRRPKNRKACGKCCNKYANGRFDERFELNVIQNY